MLYVNCNLNLKKKLKSKIEKICYFQELESRSWEEGVGWAEEGKEGKIGTTVIE